MNQERRRDPATYHINNLSPRTSDSNDGLSPAAPLATIGRAAALAQPGDTVLVHPGVYRERVTPLRGGEPDRPITYQATAPGAVTVKGSDVWTPEWRHIAGSVYEATFGDLFRGGRGEEAYHPFRIALRRMPGRKTLGQVFVEGALLTEVDDEAALHRRPGAYMVLGGESATGLRVHFPPGAATPQSAVVEVTTRSRIFAPYRRGLGYIHINGFVFEHCANQFPSGFWEPEKGAPQAGAVGFRSGHHWQVRRCVIRHTKSIGLDCGSEGGSDLERQLFGTPEEARPERGTVGWHVIEDCTISDNGACGIAGWDHQGTVIRGNVIERNNCLGHTAPEIGGIKVHLFTNGLIEGNLLRDNDCFGIWLDNVYYDSRVTRNVCIGNQGAGIFMELGDGPCLVDNNVCALTRNGEGIYTHDASGVTYAHNLLYGNSHFGIYMRTVTERPTHRPDGERVVVESSRNRIIGNVFVDNWRGHLCLPLPSERAKSNESDHNLFIGGTQWHWEGVGLHPFVVNNNARRVETDCVVEALRRALDELNVPAEERPNLTHWARQPYVDLALWRAMMGMDTHSVAPAVKAGEVVNGAVEKGGANLSELGLYVDFKDAALFPQVSVPPVEGVDCDLYGVPMPLDRTRCRVGPFQSGPETGPVRWELWPLLQRHHGGEREAA